MKHVPGEINPTYLFLISHSKPKHNLKALPQVINKSILRANSLGLTQHA